MTMDSDKGMVFTRSMRESASRIREAAMSLRVCMAVLDREDPVESLVWESVDRDRAMLEDLADRLDESAPGGNGY